MLSRKVLKTTAHWSPIQTSSKTLSELIKTFDVIRTFLSPTVDREKEKERLQNICFGMNEIPDDDDEPTQKEVNFNLEAKYFKYERMKERE